MAFTCVPVHFNHALEMSGSVSLVVQEFYLTFILVTDIVVQLTLSIVLC